MKIESIEEKLGFVVVVGVVVEERRILAEKIE